MRDGGMQKRLILVLGSLAISGITCLYPFLHRHSADFQPALYRSYWISGLWALMCGLVLMRFGRKALWILVGLPLCLFWPFIMVGLYTACELGIDCL